MTHWSAHGENADIDEAIEKGGDDREKDRGSYVLGVTHVVTLTATLYNHQAVEAYNAGVEEEARELELITGFPWCTIRQKSVEGS